MTSIAPLPMKRKIAYAMPAFALALVGIPVYVHIPKFYTDVVGVNIAVVGFLLFGVRIFDAVTDPLIGWVSDRSRLAMGRRRPFILAGALLLALTVLFLFIPPTTLSAPVKVVWFAVWIYALFLFWTLVAVPYESLGPELTFDYNERTSLFAIRDGFLILGTLAAASAPVLIQTMFSLPDTPAGERSKFFWMAVWYAPLLTGAAAWCFFRVRETYDRPAENRLSLKKGIGLMVRNRPFMVLLAAYTISAVGSNLPAALILYYVQYVLKSTHADLFLLLYFVTGIVFLPFWIRLAGRMGKKNAWLLSMGINSGAFLGVFFLGEGNIMGYAALVFLSGIGFGATLALPSAIQADVIDYDELMTGRRREGQYIGLWSIAKKLSAAVGIGLGLWGVGAAGYVPNVEQTESVKWVIRTLYALVPSVCNLAAIAIAAGYPISGRIHRKIRDAIDQRKNGIPVADPLQPGRILSPQQT